MNNQTMAAFSAADAVMLAIARQPHASQGRIADLMQLLACITITTMYDRM
jgi:hypothetical protein